MTTISSAPGEPLVARRGLLGSPRVARFGALALGVYFATEWVVSASWRGQYGYRAIPVGPLGTEFCGPKGNWPCSAIYPVMNLGFAITGLAIVLLAAGWLTRGAIPTAGGVALISAGAGLVIAGIITQRVDYPAHVAAMSVFYVLGSLGIFYIGTSHATRLSVLARAGMVMAGALSTVSYFAYAGGLTGWLGDGGAERAIIYPILVALVVAGAAGDVTSAADRTSDPVPA